MKQFVVKKHDTLAEWWVCRDTFNGVTIEWKNREYNDQQKVTCEEKVLMEKYSENLANELARILRELGAHLALHHPEKVFDLPPRRMLGEHIAQLRIHRGVSVRDLAQRCDLSPTTIVNIQAGNFSPRYEIVEKILQELGARIELIID